MKKSKEKEGHLKEIKETKKIKEIKSHITKNHVTPWEVSGDIEYTQLIKEFGTEPLDEKILIRLQKITKEEHFMLKRKIFFSNRDLKWLLDEYEKGNKFFLYTGRASSGPVHLGHLLPWIFTKWLQDKFDVDVWFQFPDEEKFLFKDNITLEETKKWTYENMLDIIALGFNPKKTHFLIDTKNANIMYEEACKIAKKITFSTVKATFGFDNDSNIGKIFYTSMQAVPAILPSVLAKKNIPCLIPLAIDQDPHFRVARDVYPKLGYYKPAIIHCKFLPGLKASPKMSTSDINSVIYTTDTPDIVKSKIMKHAFSGGKESLEEHRRLGGNPNVDISYKYLEMLFEPDDNKLEKVYNDYKSGRMLTGELKQYLIDKINDFLKEHQKKRELAKNQLDKFLFKS